MKKSRKRLDKSLLIDVPRYPKVYTPERLFEKLINETWLLAQSKVFKNYVMFAPEYKLEKLKDELDEDS